MTRYSNDERKALKDIFARRGDRVTAEDGTVVAIVKNDLKRHTTTRPADFAWIDRPPPVKGDKIEGPGFRTLPDGRPQVCIEGKWKPEPREAKHA